MYIQLGSAMSVPDREADENSLFSEEMPSERSFAYNFFIHPPTDALFLYTDRSN